MASNAAFNDATPASVPFIPEDAVRLETFLNDEARRGIAPLAQRQRRGTPFDNPEQAEAFRKQAERFVFILEHVPVQPSMQILLKRLTNIVLSPEYKFAPDSAIYQRIKTLRERWDEEDWGAVAYESQLPDSDPEGTAAPTAPTRRTISRDTTSPTRRPPAQLPPRDHEIYGEGGIMDGVLWSNANNHIAYSRNLEAIEARGRKSNVFGANGLTPGQWFPTSLAALAHGAHGAHQSGISGSSKTGAQSVVISGMYDEYDKDEGDVVFYSGSGSLETPTDGVPRQRKNATEAMLTSWRNRQPVRLLRRYGAKSRFAPPVGFRYDGLYRIIRHQERQSKNGPFDQFVLQREPGQEPLEDIIKRSPTAREIALFGRIKDGY